MRSFQSRVVCARLLLSCHNITCCHIASWESRPRLPESWSLLGPRLALRWAVWFLCVSRAYAGLVSRCVLVGVCICTSALHCGCHEPSSTWTLPLPLGWYGDDVVCRNPYSSANRSYSLLMNCEPLSVWQTTGTPNRPRSSKRSDKQLPGTVNSPAHRYLG